MLVHRWLRLVIDCWRRGPNRSTTGWKLVLLGGIIVIGIGALLWRFPPSAVNQSPELPLSEVIQLARQGAIRRITVQDDTWIVERRDSAVAAWSQSDPNVDLYGLLRHAGVPDDQVRQIEVVYQPPAQVGGWVNLAVPVLFVVLLLVILLYVAGHGSGSNDRMLSFVRIGPRPIQGHEAVVSFADVAGIDDVKAELQEVVDFLQRPEKFAALGARIPRGILLVGAPGTGKTLLARAVAGEANVPFFNLSGSEFVELFVGVGAARVRDLFRKARKRAPCIVFVDEIDAIGRRRGVSGGPGQEEREQALNQILVEMDGFDARTGVIVVAATNRPDILDPALLRPGRFDRQLVVDRPDLDGRRAILEVHTRGKPLSDSVDPGTLASQTPGFSGADLANLVNEAAILAVRRNKVEIGQDELEEAIDRVVAGPGRKARLISAEEKLVIAYHEAGHTIVARMLPGADPVQKVSIVARGDMGGFTRLLPRAERYLWSKSQFEDALCWTLGGRVAEEIVFGETTSGAANDLQRATVIARRMVAEYGMSKRIGPMTVASRDRSEFPESESGERWTWSEQTAKIIDREIGALMGMAERRARALLAEHRLLLDRLAQRLVREETLDRDELEKCLARGS
jgi:cell division protease FtsH